MMRLYRGISNVRQMINILNNWTAGGREASTLHSFDEFISSDSAIEKLIVKQVGPDAEKVWGIVCIDDSILTERSVIEYTECPDIAKRFGLLGVVSIEIEDRFVDKKISSEGGRFCLSSAPVIITDVTLKQNITCHHLSAAYNYFVQYREVPKDIDNKMYDICRCAYKR